MHAEEGDNEAREDGYGVGGVRGVESLEQNDGSDQSRGRESDVVRRVDTI